MTQSTNRAGGTSTGRCRCRLCPCFVRADWLLVFHFVRLCISDPGAETGTFAPVHDRRNQNPILRTNAGRPAECAYWHRLSVPALNPAGIQLTGSLPLVTDVPAPGISRYPKWWKKRARPRWVQACPLRRPFV